jgi:hypothetical protein
MRPSFSSLAATLRLKHLIEFLKPNGTAMTVIERIENCRKGIEPSLVARVPSGWFCLAEVQPVIGYIAYGVLYADPVAHGYNSLTVAQRGQWGIDCGTCGDALIEVLGASRANYETWGNVDPSLHTHITARFDTEPALLRVKTPREAYDWSKGQSLDFSEINVQQVMQKLKTHIESRT